MSLLVYLVYNHESGINLVILHSKEIKNISMNINTFLLNDLWNHASICDFLVITRTIPSSTSKQTVTTCQCQLVQNQLSDIC